MLSPEFKQGPKSEKSFLEKLNDFTMTVEGVILVASAAALSAGIAPTVMAKIAVGAAAALGLDIVGSKLLKQMREGSKSSGSMYFSKESSEKAVYFNQSEPLPKAA